MYSLITTICQMLLSPMRKIRSAALGLASVILLSSPAVASETEEKQLKKGWYFHVGVGTTILFGSDVDWNVGGNEYSGSLSNDWGGAVEGGVGYDFGEWSADLIYKYRWFDNENFSFSGNRFGTNLANVSVGNSDWQTLLLGIYKDFQAPIPNSSSSLALLQASVVTTPQM